MPLHTRRPLQALYGADVTAVNRVEIVADVALAGAADIRLEEVVARVGGEPGVT